MWQKLSNIRIPLEYNMSVIRREIEHKVGKCGDFELYKLSLDCRKKNDIHYIATVVVDCKKNDKLQSYTYEKKHIKELVNRTINSGVRPIIIGSGPCGMFASLVFAEYGLRPIILERGEAVDDRKVTVAKFFAGEQLNEDSNIQFGEGGAGTFSDGKLNTGINSDLIRIMLNEYVQFGANPDILYNSKPHIGTDVLRQVVKNMRNRIMQLGGEIRFNSKVEDVRIDNGRISAVNVRGEWLESQIVILACGHSARDTMEMLYNYGVAMESKAFAIGARIEHEQSVIDIAQYGRINENLPASDYKLSTKLSNERGCFTFCMCPGGYVMPSTSEVNSVVTNGMSEQKRDSGYANSAILVGVNPSDYGNGVLGGIEFQRKYERLAYDYAKDYKAPCVKVSDFVNNKSTKSLDNIKTTYARGVENVALERCLPQFVVDGMRQGIRDFDKKISGFSSSGVLIGVETRSSSPIRILRGDSGESVNVKGLYPCGEGAGYAGGITSSAVDGMKVALKIIEQL